MQVLAGRAVRPAQDPLGKGTLYGLPKSGNGAEKCPWYAGVSAREWGSHDDSHSGTREE